MPVQDARTDDSLVFFAASERKENRAFITLRPQVSERDLFFSRLFRHFNDIMQKIDGECGFPFGIAIGDYPFKTRIPFQKAGNLSNAYRIICDSARRSLTAFDAIDPQAMPKLPILFVFPLALPRFSPHFDIHSSSDRLRVISTAISC